LAISRISRIQPVAFSESSSSRRRGRGLRHLSFRGWPDFKPKQPTGQQLFELAMAKQMERHSFIDKVKSAPTGVFEGGKDALSWTFDKILRSNYAMAEGSRRALANKGEGWNTFAEFGKGFSRGIQGKRKTLFSDVLKQEGWLEGHGKAHFAASFGADVLLDPTTYLTLGYGGVAKTGMKGAGQAAHQVGRRVIEDKVATVTKTGKAPTKRQAQKQWTDAVKTLEAGGEDYKWRKALAVERGRQTGLKEIGESDRAALSQFKEAALREEKATQRRLPKLSFMGKQITPTTIGGKQVVPHLPRIANRLAKMPKVGAPIRGWRTTFGHGRADVIRGIRVTQKHTVEKLSNDYLEFARKSLETLPKIDPERAIKVLAKFEEKGGVQKVVHKKGGTDYVINEDRIQKLVRGGEMTDEEADFVRGWHGIAQWFHGRDKDFGVKYQHMGEKGKLYVPHLMDKVGMPYTIAQKNLLKTQGYVKGRKKDYLSLAQIARWVEEGKLPREIETDPYKLIASMARTRAHQHADKAAVSFISRAVGVQKRIVSDKAIAKIQSAEAERDLLDTVLQKFNTPQLRNLKQVKVLSKKRKELDASIKKLRSGKKNKAVTNDMVDLEDLRDEFGNKIAVEPEIAQALKRVEKIVDPTEDVAISKFGRGWASMVGRWKLLVTAINPGYRVRNTMSDFWNMYVAGVPTWAFGRYGGRAARVMIRAKKGDPEAIRVLDDAYRAGVLSGLFGGDIDTIALMLKSAGSKTALAKNKKFIRLTSKVAQDMNRNAENWGRLVHYLYRKEHQKMSSVDAAWEVKKAHFDYEDLTAFERQKVKGMVIPFYTWSRKNIPFQIQAIATRPGKYATFPKFALEMEAAAGGDEGTILPDYMTRNFSFQIPAGEHTYYTPQLGMGDLSRFFSGKEQALRSSASMVNPFLKIPAEIITNKSFFTGQEINPKTGHPRQPISDWAAPFISLIPGSDVGQTRRGDKTGMGAHPWISYAFGQTPWTRFAFLGGSKVKGKGYAPALSQIGGLQITTIDPEQQLMFERMDLKEKLERRIKGLRDEGAYPQARRRKESEYERRIQRMIAQGLGRPGG
jgi:hypothetical protein